MILVKCILILFYQRHASALATTYEPSLVDYFS